MVKKWFSETRRVDRDTGELLDKARTVRENWRELVLEIWVD